LFKGLYFKDIKLHNLYIKTLFVKIDKKIILKANSITIIPKQKISQDIVSIHKQIYYISKIINLFEEFNIKNIKYKNLTIPLIIYKNRQIEIKSPFIQLKGTLYPYKNYTILNNLSLKFKNYSITDISGSLLFKNNISFSIKGKINKNSFYLSGLLNNKDNLLLDVKSKKINLNIENHNIKAKDVFAKIFLNLHYINPTVHLEIADIDVDNKYFVKRIKTYYKNHSLSFSFKNALIKKLKKIKDIKITYTKGSYFFKDPLLIISKNDSISLKYDKFHIYLLKNTLIFKNKNNFNLYSKTIKGNYKNYHLTSYNAIVIKFYKFLLFEIKNTTLKSKLIKIYNDIIYGYKNRVEIPNIKAKYKNIQLKLTNALINIAHKKAVIEKINVNGFLFSPTFISFSNNIIKAKTTSSNIYINKNLKKILKDFNISLPLTQMHGKNFLKFNLNYNLKNNKYSYLADINSSNGVFKFNDLMFSYKRLKAQIDNKFINSSIKHFYTSLDFLKTDFDANATINLKEKYLNAYSLINKLKILNFVNVTNFKEKIVGDFKNNMIYFLNSDIIINLSQNEILLLKLKKLLKYTPFKNIIEDGGIFIKIAKQVLINGTLELKKPVFMNQKNPKQLNALIVINDKNISVQNSFIHLKITNLEKYNAYLENAEINIKNLIEMYNQLSKILTSNTNSNNNKNTLFILKSKNTNFIYGKHKFLSQEASIKYDKNLKIFSKYKTSTLNGYTKQGYFLLEGKNYHKEELVALLDFFKHFKRINLDFILVKSPDNFYTGKIYLNKSILNELTTLNNIVAFLNTIPSLLSLSTPGFSAKGYKIKKGEISYLFYKNILYLKKIKIIGENIDFYGKGYINLEKNTINLKITAVMKMKLKKIPIIGKGLSYILFGKDGNIDVKIVVKGDLNNPKVSQDLGKTIILTPFELFKRVLTLPFNIF
jgi:hypothetical protein